MTMYRLSWGNGPLNCDNYGAGDLPNTIIQVADTFCPQVPHFHRRVNHVPGCDPTTESWGWYTAWRDCKEAWVNDLVQYPKIHGIGVDELFPNHENLPNLITEMGNVDWWCDSSGVPKPQWVIAINPGQDAAVDYVINNINRQFPGRVWWFVEGYIGAYKGAGEGYGLDNARALLARFVGANLQSRAIYGLNLSHYGSEAAPVGPYYYNVYASDPSLGEASRNQEIYSRLEDFVPEVVSNGAPFGFGIWTPGYTSQITREDGDSILSAAGA